MARNPKIHFYTLHPGDHAGDFYTDAPGMVTCPYCKKVLERKAELKGKQERSAKANELIKVIASCGRDFFNHKGLVSKFFIDHHGHIWFVDAYSKKQIYTHYTRGRWRGFSEGGTLRDVVIRLRDYIRTGEHCINVFGPWPSWYSDGDPWGYGEHMQTVRNAAIHLGIIKPPAPQENLSAENNQVMQKYKESLTNYTNEKEKE